MHPIDSPIIDLRLNTSSAHLLLKTNHQHPLPIKVIIPHWVGYFASMKLVFNLSRSTKYVNAGIEMYFNNGILKIIKIIVAGQNKALNNCWGKMTNLEEGKTPLVGETLIVYGRRWYILALFSFLALYQCCVWNTWGPVVNSVQVSILLYLEPKNLCWGLGKRI